MGAQIKKSSGQRVARRYLSSLRVSLRYAKVKLEEAPYLFPEAGNESPKGVQSDIKNYRNLSVEERKELNILWYLLGEKGTPPFKFTKLEAAYTDSSPYQQDCENCMSAYLHPTTDTYICDQMRGVIKPAGWCRLWKKPISKSEYRKYQEG